MRSINGLMGHAAKQAASIPQSRFGLVENYDADRHVVRVSIQPEGTLTGWIPIATPTVGNGVGIIVGPTVGQQAFLSPHGQDWVVTGFAFSDQNPPPMASAAIRGDKTPIASGEVVVVGPKGSEIRIASDGTIFIKAGTINFEGDLNVSGDIHTEKSVFADKDVKAKANIEADVDVKAKAQVSDSHGTVKALRDDYNAHQHTSGVGGKTSTTTKPD